MTDLKKLNDTDYPERSTVCCQQNERIALCRCWQSKKFPYCDGAHRAYNDAHGTAFGPVIVNQPEVE